MIDKQMYAPIIGAQCNQMTGKPYIIRMYTNWAPIWYTTLTPRLYVKEMRAKWNYSTLCWLRVTENTKF